MKKLVVGIAFLFNILILIGASPAQEDITLTEKLPLMELMEVVCDRGKIFHSSDKLACKVCPSFTCGGSMGSREKFTLDNVIYGSFIKVGVMEAVLDFSECESHATNYGGSVLLQFSNQGWKKNFDIIKVYVLPNVRYTQLITGVICWFA